MDIEITTSIPPAFTPIGPLCQNSTAPSLPNISNNGITGIWNPAAINTTTAGSVTYAFTPAAGQCATTTTMDIIVVETATSPTVGIITQPTCSTASGSVILNGLPATGIWTINPGAIAGTGVTATIPGLAPATYNFTVTNAAGCTSLVSANVIIAPQPVSPATPLQTIDCTLGSGNATIIVTSPIGAGIQYRLDGGAYQTGTTFTGIANGSHTITVMNASGCTTAGTIFSVSCGCPNGPSLTLSSISGSTCGTLPVTVSGNIFSGSATLVTITGNGAGSISSSPTGTSPFAFTYTPAAGDAGNSVLITVTTDNPLGSPCAEATATYTLIVNAVPAVPTTELIQPICALATGTITVTAPTGPGMTFSIDGSTYTNTTGIFTLLTANTYIVTARSPAGCVSASANVVINAFPGAPAAPTAGTITQPTCEVATGSVILNDLPAGSWTINPGAITGTGASTTIAELATGIYNFTVTNAAGCISQASANVVINSATGVSAALSEELSDYNGFNISCYGKSDGYIRINPSGDFAPYIFSWIGPGGFASSDEDISGLKAGQYILTITNVNGCSINAVFELTEPRKLSMTIGWPVSSDGGYNLNCAGLNTVSVSISAINNVGQVIYRWSDGYTGNNRTYISSGINKIIITDSNNCNADSTITLTAPDSLKLTFDVTEPFCPDNSDGEIRLTVTGGIRGSDYIYKWSDNSTGKNLSNISEGFYKVTVGDLNGCSAKDSIQVNSMNETCLSIPNAISPNGDFINDEWNIGNIQQYPLAEIKIFNNWGVTVWKSEKGYPHPWDGRSNGIILPIDSYFYIINLHNGSKLIAGSVTIIK
jgi:gliding motility-associated-like protein